MNAAEEADKKDGQPGRIVKRGTTIIGGPPSPEYVPGEYNPSSLFGEVTMKPAEPWWIEQPGDAPTPEQQRVAMPRPELLNQPLPKPTQERAEPYHGDDDFDRYCRIAVVLCAEGMTNDQAKKAATRVMTEVLEIDIRHNPNWIP